MDILGLHNNRSKLRVLVACEFSGRVRDAFIRRGHDSISVDLLPTEAPGPHHQGDVLEFAAQLGQSFDLCIAFPPCTYLAASGARYWASRRVEQDEAIAFVHSLTKLAPRWAVENPQGVLSTVWRRPDQYVCHSWFGEDYTKRTGLWLGGLPPLMATLVAAGPQGFVQAFPHSGSGHRKDGEHWRRRVRIPLGMADAMASQWG